MPDTRFGCIRPYVSSRHKEKMDRNYHTHTPRCKHASGSEREYIEAAIAKGFTELGFSDHVPQPYPDGFKSGIRMDMAELPDYTETLISLREEYKDRINILIGYEVEYSLAYFDKLLKELRRYPLDYIIQGQHFAPDEVNGFYVGYPTDEEEKLKAYVDVTIKGMKTGMFSYLAHPDLINYTGDDDTYRRHMCQLIATSIDLKIPLEVNFLGFTDGRNYPCDRFFSLASEMGASFILGCDAHNPGQLQVPSDIAGLPEFLERHHICYDQTLKLGLL